MELTLIPVSWIKFWTNTHLSSSLQQRGVSKMVKIEIVYFLITIAPTILISFVQIYLIYLESKNDKIGSLVVEINSPRKDF